MQKSHDNQPLRGADYEPVVSAQAHGGPRSADAYVRKPLSREEAVSAVSFSLAGYHSFLSSHVWGS